MLAEWLDAPTPERVILTPSATIALNIAILGADLQPGNAVYVTPFEHNSVLRPVEHLRGTRTVVVVDGAQTVGLYPLPLGDGLIDALVFSGHKSLYGPYGVAGLVLASDWRPAPILFGGTGRFSESVAMPDELASAYEPGSPNIWAVAGLKAALEWLWETWREAMIAHTLELAQSLRELLSALPSVTVYAPPQGEGAASLLPNWCGILAFTLEGIAPQALEAALGAWGIAVRAGLHCARWAHRWLGTLAEGEAVRVSGGWYNQAADSQALLNGMSLAL